MTGTTEAAREIDRVLDGLRGHDLFRKNAFRVTGLAPDATPRQVRRAKEESRNAYYLPPDAAGAPLPPSTDPVELRAAFEVLQDPVARLVHELLWAGSSGHNARAEAVRLLCRALEGTTERGTVLTETAWAGWRKGLRSWADAMRSEATWEQARRRVAEIDDPRVTVALVRTLRQRLQLHVVGVAAGAAARDARTSAGTAGRLVRAVREAGFDADDVTRALRASAQPLLDEVKDACRTARSGDPARSGMSAARTLLDTVGPHLRAVTALLGDDDELARSGRDDVALTTNNCVVAYANEHAAALGGEPQGFRDVIGLLALARVYASTPRTTELVDKNIAEYSRAEYTLRRLKEATEAARRSGVSRAGGRSGAGSVGTTPARQGRAAPTSPGDRLRLRSWVPRLVGWVAYVLIWIENLGLWGGLLVLGPVPAVGIGLGATALGLPWFWFVAATLIVAFYVSTHLSGYWGELHFWLLLLPAGLTWLVTTWLGGPTEWLTLAALTISILIATAKETG